MPKQAITNFPGVTGGNKLIINYGGVDRYGFLVAQIHDQWKKGLGNVHVRAAARVYSTSEALFRADIKRPDSQGVRAGNNVRKQRMTGKFTFGRGQAFEVQLINDQEGHQYGFGFPKIPEADRRTKGIWRSLEFGLGPRGEAGPLGPPGPHILPRIFHFQGTTLMLGRGPRATRGGPRAPTFRISGDRFGAGFEGKGFLRDGARLVAEQMPREYRQVFTQTFGRG